MCVFSYVLTALIKYRGSIDSRCVVTPFFIFFQAETLTEEQVEGIKLLLNKIQMLVIFIFTLLLSLLLQS